MSKRITLTGIVLSAISLSSLAVSHAAEPETAEPLRLPDDTMGARMEAGVLGATVLSTSEMGRLGLKRDADH